MKEIWDLKHFCSGMCDKAIRTNLCKGNGPKSNIISFFIFLNRILNYIYVTNIYLLKKYFYIYIPVSELNWLHIINNKLLIYVNQLIVN